MNELFQNLFIFEVANNHQGSVEHGKKIIQAVAKAAQKYNVNAAIKLQYRDLDTFIHPKYKDKKDVKHIPRFMGTRLTDEQFKELLSYVRENGLKTIVTPFDERSVQKCVDHNVDIIKIGSCSADDWPLLEEIAKTGKPVIASTGGLSIKRIDSLVTFFEHKNISFALMHCVSLYPTPNHRAQMDFLARLLKRYPNINIGYSGHEAPENFDIGKIAVATGAQILERHIGVPTDTIKLNEYSMNPEQFDKWLSEIQKAKEIMRSQQDKIIDKEEQDSLLSLRRGVFASRAIQKGEELGTDDVFFAMPCLQGQLASGEFGQYSAKVVATRDYKEGDPIVEEIQLNPVYKIRDILHKCKGMLQEAGIPIGGRYTIEISHHFGVDRFPEIGCVLINLISRNYCKKIIVVLPGQRNPSHKHHIKEETFCLLNGDLIVTLDGEELNLKVGDHLLIPTGKTHDFRSEHGAIFEEVSTTNIPGDSYYEDPEIARLDPMQRKTVTNSW